MLSLPSIQCYTVQGGIIDRMDAQPLLWEADSRMNGGRVTLCLSNIRLFLGVSHVVSTFLCITVIDIFRNCNFPSVHRKRGDSRFYSRSIPYTECICEEGGFAWVCCGE